jgi:hypothetical protein
VIQLVNVEGSAISDFGLLSAEVGAELIGLLAAGKEVTLSFDDKVWIQDPPEPNQGGRGGRMVRPIPIVKSYIV